MYFACILHNSKEDERELFKKNCWRKIAASAVWKYFGCKSEDQNLSPYSSSDYVTFKILENYIKKAKSQCYIFQ